VALLKFEVNEESAGSAAHAMPHARRGHHMAKEEVARIDPEKCIKCRSCILACKFHSMISPRRTEDGGRSGWAGSRK